MIDELKKDFSFPVDPLKDEVLKQVFLDHPLWRMKLEENRTKPVIEKMMSTLKARDTFDLEITGDLFKGKGIGKSYIAIRLKEIFDKERYGEFNFEQVFYTIDDYLRYYMNNPDMEKTVSLVDENVTSIGTGAYAEQIRFKNIQTTNRFKSNSTFRMTTEVKRMVCEYIIKPIFIDYEQGVSVSLVFDYRNRYCLGSLYVRKPEKKLTDKYELWKNKNIESIIKQEKRKLIFDDMAKLVIEKYELKPIWDEMLDYMQQYEEYKSLPLKQKQQTVAPKKPLNWIHDKDLKAYISREREATQEEKEYIVTTIYDILKGKNYLNK